MEKKTEAVISAKPKKTSKAAKKKAPAARKPSLVDQVVEQLEDDKAQDIVRIELGENSSLADAMVIATGGSNRQLAAMSDHLVERLKTLDAPKALVDGKDQGDWVLIDAGDVIVHLFRQEVREFYNLEKLWGAASAGRGDAEEPSRLGSDYTPSLD